MITLITGTPGAGKSLQAVYRIKRAIESGRAVYTDIDGIDIPGVNVIDLDHKWMDTPEGSLVVYDECQRRWPSTGRPGHAPDEDIRALETHRHTGHDIIVCTQHPTLVHHHVRKLVGEHVHVRRVSNAPVVTLFTSQEVFDPADARALRKVDKAAWKYPKDLFSCYASATKHTHKFKMPTKFKVLGGFLVLLIGGVIYAFMSIDLPTADNLADTQTQPRTPRAEGAAGPAAGALPLADPRSRAAPGGVVNNPGLVSAASVAPLPVIAGCLKTATRCRCWSLEGLPLDTSPQQCDLLLAEMPTTLGGFKSSRAAGSSEGSTDDQPVYSSIPPSADLDFRANGALGVY